VDVLARMGADLEVDRDRGDVRVRAGALGPTEVAAEEVPGLVDEVPVLAVAAAHADGDTVFRGVGELRVKESDRLATIVSELGALGVRSEVSGDDLVVHPSDLGPAAVTSHGDHRIAMAAAIAGLAAEGTTTISGWAVVATSYPGFVADLEELTGP
jgi:3-phosphoshikimate 1-carboxyvinyltransferase